MTGGNLKIALISGDGLAVSGLLTVFRNVLELAPPGLLSSGPVPADLGYSWRPDKPSGFFGTRSMPVPPWLEVVSDCPPWLGSAEGHAVRLLRVRQAVSDWDGISGRRRRQLCAEVSDLRMIYQRHFRAFLERAQPDYVFALNMTLSDAVSVSGALADAASDYFALHRGGVVFWDHDLFGSYAVRSRNHTSRIYPSRPNALTPLPREIGSGRWVVVTEELRREALGYAAGFPPEYLPNVLPDIARAGSPASLDEFRRQEGLVPGRPVLLNPVRIFGVKGVDWAIQFQAALRQACRAAGQPVPYLLVFGALDEDAEYARSLQSLVRELNLADDIRFLDGVPLAQERSGGKLRLDERGLLRLAQTSHGGVVFTPSVPDVESVGLGPALAAVAGIPVVVSRFHAYQKVYGAAFRAVHLDGISRAPATAARFAGVLRQSASGDPGHLQDMTANRRLIADRFPDGPWRGFWASLHGSLYPSGQEVRSR